MGGTPFGVAAFATPAASVAGQSANPLVNMDTKQLLQHEATHRMLARAGVMDSDGTATWLAGPEEVTPRGKTNRISYLTPRPP